MSQKDMKPSATGLGSSSWKVLPHPLLAKKHRFHENRFVVSSDAVVEIYDENPDVRNAHDWDMAWGLRNGVIICELKDSAYQQRYANLIAAAPDLLAACTDNDLDAAHDALSEVLETPGASVKSIIGASVALCIALNLHHEIRNAAIAKATGGAS